MIGVIARCCQSKTSRRAFCTVRRRLQFIQFSSPDLEQMYRQRMVQSSIHPHMYFVVILSVVLVSSSLQFSNGRLSRPALTASAALWFLHSSWLALLRFKLPSMVSSNTIPAAILLIDCFVMGAANPEAQNVWGSSLVCHASTDFSYETSTGFCHRIDFPLNFILAVSVITLFGTLLLRFKQAVCLVPTAYVVYCSVLLLCNSGSAHFLFNPQIGWYAYTGLPTILAQILVTLVVRYSSERSDRDQFLAHSTQLMVTEAHANTLRATRGLCRSVFDCVFFLKRGTLQFCDDNDARQLTVALSVGGESSSNAHAHKNGITDFFLNQQECERFQNYVKECSHDTRFNADEVPPTQLISVFLQDETRKPVSTKVYCTLFHKLNLDRPFDNPDDSFLVGLIWEGTSSVFPTPQVDVDAPIPHSTLPLMPSTVALAGGGEPASSERICARSPERSRGRAKLLSSQSISSRSPARSNVSRSSGLSQQLRTINEEPLILIPTPVATTAAQLTDAMCRWHLAEHDSCIDVLRKSMEYLKESGCADAISPLNGGQCKSCFCLHERGETYCDVCGCQLHSVGTVIQL